MKYRIITKIGAFNSGAFYILREDNEIFFGGKFSESSLKDAFEPRPDEVIIMEWEE